LPGQTTAITQKKLELRKKALEANKADLPQMEVILQQVDTTLTELKNLTADQASQTASKQQTTKRLAEVNSEAQKLITFVDAGIRSHYGTRAEKLVEFGQQPFRSQPRIKVVGVDGKPVVKPTAAPAEPPAPLLKE
jgi:hypothetical protein